MNDNRNDNTPRRRDVLRLIGLGGVATAAAAASGGAPETKAAAQNKPAAPGYRETEHVKKFYETARF